MGPTLFPADDPAQPCRSLLPIACWPPVPLHPAEAGHRTGLSPVDGTARQPSSPLLEVWGSQDLSSRAPRSVPTVLGWTVHVPFPICKMEVTVAASQRVWPLGTVCMAHLAQCAATPEGLSVIGAQPLEADGQPEPGSVGQGAPHPPHEVLYF